MKTMYVLFADQDVSSPKVRDVIFLDHIQLILVAVGILFFDPYLIVYIYIELIDPSVSS